MKVCVYLHIPEHNFKSKCLIFGKSAYSGGFEHLVVSVFHILLDYVLIRVSSFLDTTQLPGLRGDQQQTSTEWDEGPSLTPRRPPINEIFTKKTVPECKQMVSTISLPCF